VADTNVTISIIDKNGNSIREFSTDAEDKNNTLTVKKGLNKLVWDMRRNNLKGIKGLMTFGGTRGTHIGPGEYTINVSCGDNAPEIFTVGVSDDPRSEISAGAQEEKQNLLNELYLTTQDVFDEVKNIRHIRGQIISFQKRDGVRNDTLLFSKGERIVATLDSLEKTIVQAKQQTQQDIVNFPNQIDGQLMHIQGTVDGSYPPITQGQKNRAGDILNVWEEKRAFLHYYLSTELVEYNRMIQERDVPFITPVAPEVAKKISKS
jgi:hypothetical protein